MTSYATTVNESHTDRTQTPAATTPTGSFDATTSPTRRTGATPIENNSSYTSTLMMTLPAATASVAAAATKMDITATMKKCSTPVINDDGTNTRNIDGDGAIDGTRAQNRRHISTVNFGDISDDNMLCYASTTNSSTNCDYDQSDSLSDGHEKTDTTPENIKKIDDVIEQRQKYQNQQQQQLRRKYFGLDDCYSSHGGGNMTQLGANAAGHTVTPLSTAGVTNYNDDDDDDESNAKLRYNDGGSSSSGGGGGGGGSTGNNEKGVLFYNRSHQNTMPSVINNKNIDDDNIKSNNNRTAAAAAVATEPLVCTCGDNREMLKTAVADDSEQTPTFSYDDDDESSSLATNTTTTTTTTANTANTNKLQSYAFTIDNFNDRDCDAATTAAKYKSMMERFQSRHRRGASMSKLESENEQKNKTAAAGALSGLSLTSSMSAATPLSTIGAHHRSVTRNAEVSEAAEVADTVSATAPKVKLRARDRSTSRVRDAAKRHSWSPRSSGSHELSYAQSEQQQKEKQHQPPTSKPLPPSQQQSGSSSTKKSAANVRSKTFATPQVPTKGTSNLMASRTAQFTPRSTAMQMALQKVDFLCSQPPLADFKHLNAVDADNISEAGTYTLDGDNYTEEQKDLMNIDKSGNRILHGARKSHRPKNLNLHVSDSGTILTASPTSTTKIPMRSSNVLEVNYYHDAQDDDEEQLQRSPQRLKSNQLTGANDLILGSHQTAGAYLEKIKSRVLRNMSATKNAPTIATAATPTDEKVTSNKPSDPKKKPKPSSAITDDEDLGCFTSVTTSGVLAKQSALDPRPKLSRRSSLSTSQIDSSEYVSNETKLKHPTAAAYAGGGFTDHQKAEYRLNVFTNQKDSQIRAATRSFIESPPDSPVSKLSDTAVLKTAHSKNDWIQEWARNARARSLANEVVTKNHHGKQQDHRSDLMTRSYTCTSDTTGAAAAAAAAGESLTDDSIYRKQCAAAAALAASNKMNRSLADRYRLAGGGGECDYTGSDPSLSSSYAASKSNHEAMCKPPKSPTKIPSPLHSIGRARSASRTRASLQNILQQGDNENEEEDDDADESANVFLQNTAAAISSLQQSLSRKNSLKSPTNSASPRAHSARAHIMYSPEECSPQHSIDSPNGSGQHHHHHHRHHQRSPVQHRRQHNVSGEYMRPQHQLMTSSINEQQLQLLTSGEYLARQMRLRKNSFDGNVGNSPIRRTVAEKYTANCAADAATTLSPLRRSSSFSTKVAGGGGTQRAARPQFQNIYTPPAARHNYIVGGHYQQAALPPPSSSSSSQMHSIQKSSSSNNFRHIYSDYDDNLQYYINDQDDIIDVDADYYSSGAEDEEAYYQGANNEDDDDGDDHEHINDGNTPNVPLSNTRYNKALLMRIERSKQKVAGTGQKVGPSSAPPQKQVGTGGGVLACPNTPEMPRRGVRSAPRAGVGASARQSMPRDTSLNRLATQVPNSLASAKKQLLQTAAAAAANTTAVAPRSASSQRIQPKYLDISKYKPAQGNTFLRKNDAKSTLKQPSDAMKRSPSASSMGLSRTDPSRNSNRSVRSINSCMTTSATSISSTGGRASSAARRDASIAKQKEAEMAMWKRRSTYDPMKAAAEDRRKKEEAKRLAMANNIEEVPSESATIEAAAAATATTVVTNATSTMCTSPATAGNSTATTILRHTQQQPTTWTLGETDDYIEEDDCN